MNYQEFREHTGDDSKSITPLAYSMVVEPWFAFGRQFATDKPKEDFATWFALHAEEMQVVAKNVMAMVTAQSELAGVMAGLDNRRTRMEETERRTDQERRAMRNAVADAVSKLQEIGETFGL